MNPFIYQATHKYKILLSSCLNKRFNKHLTTISDWDRPKI